MGRLVKYAPIPHIIGVRVRSVAENGNWNETCASQLILARSVAFRLPPSSSSFVTVTSVSLYVYLTRLVRSFLPRFFLFLSPTFVISP